MAHRLAIAQSDIVKDIVAIRVADGGFVKKVNRCLISTGNNSEEVFPPLEDSGDKRITWQDGTIHVRQKSVETLDSNAVIWFNRSQGFFYFNDYPNADRIQGYMNPPLDGTVNDNGKYLIRAAIQSGSVISGSPTEAWLDLNADSQYQWELIQGGGVVGSKISTYIITIAADDGAGSPVASTQVHRTVNFDTEVLAASDIGWDATQRDLVEIKQGEIADCSLTFDPLGSSVGDADTSGAFNEAWLRSGGDPTGMTVKATLFSGTAPDGSSLGFDLPLDQTRQWVLLANSGENLSSELDVTVTDGGVTRTKRVTMNSQYTLPPTSSAWLSQPQWQISDLIDDAISGMVISMGADGIGVASRFSDSVEVENENWHSQAPTPTDPENYEIKLTHITGFKNRISGSPLDIWINGADSPNWTVTMVENSGVSSWYWDVSVRRIGGLTVDKRVIVTLGRATDDDGQPIDPTDPPDIGDGNIPPGGSIP